MQRDTPYYLKPNVKFEPLIHKWYAWPYLIPPLTAACNITKRHIPIMQSYVNSPAQHEIASKNTDLIGGPFINLNNRNVEAVQALLDETYKNCENLTTLEREVNAFSVYLSKNLHGESLETTYTNVPETIRGMVELVYDENNNPKLRFIEHLLYQQHYSKQAQSVSLSLMQSDDRPFILSTPRLETDNEVLLNLPFDSTALDKLFKMKETADDLEVTKQRLQVTQDKEALFESFFTKNPPPTNDNRHYVGDEVRIRYFGHACVLVQSRNVTILIDPIISYDYPSDLMRYTFSDLPDKIDYIILTHNHQDHVVLETLLQLRHKTNCIIVPDNVKGSLLDPSLKLILTKLGFSNIQVMDEFGQIKLTDGCITAIPFLGEHADLNIHSKLAYHITLNNKSFLFTVDSNNLEPKLYEFIFKELPSVDMLFIGMECDGAPLSWLYGPLMQSTLSRAHDKSRSLSGSNAEKALDIVKHANCKQAHIYAMGQEPWLNHIMGIHYTENSLPIIESDAFIKQCQAQGIQSKRLYASDEWHL